MSYFHSWKFSSIADVYTKTEGWLIINILKNKTFIDLIVPPKYLIPSCLFFFFSLLPYILSSLGLRFVSLTRIHLIPNYLPGYYLTLHSDFHVPPNSWPTALLTSRPWKYPMSDFPLNSKNLIPKPSTSFYVSLWVNFAPMLILCPVFPFMSLFPQILHHCISLL